MTPELVSILTPTWNCTYLPGFKRSLRSVDAQTYPHWEHIVMSDGEHESAAAEVCANVSNRKYLVASKHHANWGNGVRQELLNHANGEYLCFLDDDDIVFPSYLARMVQALTTNPEAAFSVCLMLSFGGAHQRGESKPWIAPGLLQPGYIGTPQVVVRSEAMRAIGWRYPDEYSADGHTYQMLGALYQHTRVEECLAIAL